MVTYWSRRQYEKAFSPIEVMLAGIEIFTIVSLSLNTPSPIAVTFLPSILAGIFGAREAYPRRDYM